MVLDVLNSEQLSVFHHVSKIFFSGAFEVSGHGSVAPECATGSGIFFQIYMHYMHYVVMF